MNTHLKIFTVAAAVLTAVSGCAHRTTTTYHTSDTVRTEAGPVPVPQPVVEDSTTVTKHSTSIMEGGLK